MTVLLVFSAGAHAQSPESRGTVGGVVGGGRTWDDESSIGGGPVAGGRIEWRVSGTTSVEASVDLLWHDRSGGFFQAEGRTIFAGGSLVHRFGSANVRPYVLGGVHIATHSGSTTFSDVRAHHTSTNVGYHFGGGFAVRAGERFDVGPEARFYMVRASGGSDPALAYWVGVRFGISLRR